MLKLLYTDAPEQNTNFDTVAGNPSHLFQAQKKNAKKFDVLTASGVSHDSNE
jgi:hypothetical protein